MENLKLELIEEETRCTEQISVDCNILLLINYHSFL